MDNFIVNDRIRSVNVVLIDADGNNLGQTSTNDALAKARHENLDLVQVATDKSSLPICKMLDYGKMKYDQSKKKQKSKNNDMKSVRFHLTTSGKDLDFKKNQIMKFLGQGRKVRVFVRLKKGREHSQQGRTRAKEVLKGIVSGLPEGCKLGDIAVGDKVVSIVVSP